MYIYKISQLWFNFIVIILVTPFNFRAQIMLWGTKVMGKRKKRIGEALQDIEPFDTLSPL